MKEEVPGFSFVFLFLLIDNYSKYELKGESAGIKATAEGIVLQIN